MCFLRENVKVDCETNLRLQCTEFLILLDEYNLDPHPYSDPNPFALGLCSGHEIQCLFLIIFLQEVSLCNNLQDIFF